MVALAQEFSKALRSSSFSVHFSNGKPKDNDSFLLFDISSLNPHLNIFNQPTQAAELEVASTRAKK